jgi:FolB domain-containing protein
MDRIFIRDLQARCIVGVNDDERREKQDVVINLTVYADLRAAGRSDRIEDALDYRELKKRILDAVEKSQHYLVEALAEDIAAVCLAHRAVQRVQVCVDKPGALRFARSVAVEVDRTREG